MIWEEILLYSLFFLLLLHIVGHPVLKSLERLQALDLSLSNLDLVQRLPLEFVLGGAIIYVWALIATPFHLFNSAAAWILAIVFAFWYAMLHLRHRSSFHFQVSSYSMLAIAVFVLALIIRVLPLSSLALGSVQDTSLHTLLVYSIIRDGGIPQSVISGATLQVPQGVHVVMAYFTLVSGVPAELVTFYELAYFNATIVLAAYCFASLLVSKEFGMIVEWLLAGISFYPIGVTWGAQWIPWGLTIFFAFVILITPKFIDKNVLAKQGLLTLLAPGIVLGYLGSTYPPLYALSIVIVFLLIVLEHKNITRKVSSLATLVALSLPLVAIWIYRLVAFSNYISPFLLQQQRLVAYETSYKAAFAWLPYRNMTTLSGISAPIYNWFSWQIIVGWPAGYLFVTLMILGAGSCALIFPSKSRSLLPTNLRRYVLAVFITILIWGLISPLGLFYYPSGVLGIMASELDKVAVLVGVILIPFIAAVPLYLIVSLFGKEKILKPKHKKLISRCVIVGLILVNLVVIPSGANWLLGNYRIYAVSSNSDYELLQWMRTGIPSNSTILVNPFDAGQYVPSIADKTTVGISSTGVFFLNPTYKELWQLLVDNVMNSTTVSLIRSLNVSYIFVGSKAFQDGWNPQVFLSHRLYFEVAQNFDSSYLFKVTLPPKNAEIYGAMYNNGFEGISDNQTFVDFRDMILFNLATGDAKYFEIVIKAWNGSQLEFLNYWSLPRAIKVDYESSNKSLSEVSLAGANGTVLVSTQSILGHGMNFTIVYQGPDVSRVVEFSILPITQFITGSLHFAINNTTNWFGNNTPISVTSPTDTSEFTIYPGRSQLYVSDSTVTVWNGDSLHFALSTSS